MQNEVRTAAKMAALMVTVLAAESGNNEGTYKEKETVDTGVPVFQ
jgi:hypothetical protein